MTQTLKYNTRRSALRHFVTITSSFLLAGSMASAADVVYSSEDFEGGTPIYSINGVNSTESPNSWFKLTDTTTTMIGTDYIAGASSRNGIVANDSPTDLPDALPGEPTGQHAFVAASQNRRLDSTYPMALASDNIETLHVSLSFMAYALGDFPALGSCVITYSDLGDFSDEVTLASFGVGQNNSEIVTPDVVATEETWTSLDLSFTEAGSGITFSDTAAIRIRRVPLENQTTDPTRLDDANLNHITFLDDIQVSGTPGVASPFDTWTGTGTLGPVTFEGDTNGDGVKDGLAFLLGAANPDDSATGLLPTVTEDGSGGLVLTFKCLDIAARGTAELRVEHSSDLGILDAWAATVDQVPDSSDPTADNGVTFVVDEVTFDPLHGVTATIDSAQGTGNELFGRVSATD